MKLLNYFFRFGILTLFFGLIVLSAHSVFAAIGLENYWNPSYGNYYNDHYIFSPNTGDTLYAFTWTFPTADNQPLTSGNPRSPVPVPLPNGTPYSIYAYYCNGTPPVWPAVFGNGCPNGGVGLLGALSTNTGTINFGTPRILKDASGNQYYILVRFLYYNFDTTSQIWQQEQLSSSRGVSPSGVRTLVTPKIGTSAANAAWLTTTDVRQRLGFCGDGRVTGGEQCDAGVNGVPTASGTCNASCQIAPSCGSSDGQTFSTAPSSNLCGSGSSTNFTGSGPWSWQCISGQQTVSCGAKLAQPSCGTDAGITSSAAPSNNLCSIGSASSVTTSGNSWSWSCNNAAGATACTSNRTPTCGSSNGQTVGTAPTSNLCGVGSASSVTGTGPWNWNCTNGSQTAACSAAITPATCGTDSGKTLTSTPTNLCGIGAASDITGSGPWSWSCAHGATTAACSAAIAPVACGTANSGVFATTPSSNLCAAGSTLSGSVASTTSAWQWTCANGSGAASCAASKPAVCGATGPFSVAPTTGLCTLGSASSVTGSGPWNWNCTNGSSTVACTAGLTAPSCGASSGTTSAVAPSSGLCAPGSSASSVTGGGSTWDWTCNNATGSATCAAFVPAACGTSHGDTFALAPTSNLCATGTASAVMTSGGSWTWACANGASSATCAATIRTPVCGADHLADLTAPPASSLCVQGAASSVSGSGPWNWTCKSAPGTPSELTGYCHTNLPVPCTFVSAGGSAAVVSTSATGDVVPHLTPETRNNAFGNRSVVKLQLDAAADSACFSASTLCVKVRAESIVGGYRHDTSAQPWSSCLNLTDGTATRYEFDSSAGALYLPVQDKQAYEVQGGVVGTSVYDSASAFFDVRNDAARVIGLAGTSGSLTLQEIKNAIQPEVQAILKPFEPLKTSLSPDCDASYRVELSSLNAGAYFKRYDASGSFVTLPIERCMNPSQDVLYFYSERPNGYVLLDGAPSGKLILPNSRLTLLLDDADLRIKNNLNYLTGSNTASFGVVALHGVYSGGDILVHPTVTHLVGSYYVEGSVLGVDAGWNLFTAAGVSRDNSAWYTALANQLFWNGTVISRNTLGGAGDPTWPRRNTPIGPRGVIVASWDQATTYDLGLLREFGVCHNSSSLTNTYGGWNFSGCSAAGDVRGARSTVSTFTEPVVVQYSNRLQNNPPPGFQNLYKILSAEVAHQSAGVYTLEGVLQRIWNFISNL